MQIEVGEIFEGKVTGIAAFGAFVEFGEGKSGLVHISEVASEYVNDVSKYLKEGQCVKVKVIGVEKGKISLSIKQAEPKPEKKPEKRQDKNFKKKERKPAKTFDPKIPPEEFEFTQNKDMSFDDMLQKFKQDSDEKFQDLKRSNEGKRSGGYKRAY